MSRRTPKIRPPLVSFWCILTLFLVCYVYLVFWEPAGYPDADTISTKTEEEDESVPLYDRPVPTDWLHCIRKYLRLDANNVPTMAAIDMADAIPLLITPIMNDAVFLPRMVCSITVPVRYHYVVLNEHRPLAVEMVDAMEREFGASGRLIVQRNPVNMGYSGSMNQGIRYGLERRNRKEVLWMMLSNLDVAYSHSMISRLVQRANQLTAHDEAMLRRLEEEVAMEERLALSGNFSYYDQYVPAGRPHRVLRSGFPGVHRDIVTAPLLPDRIRYMYAHESIRSNVAAWKREEKYFSNHTGMLAAIHDGQSSTIMTRLLFSTVGYFDENFYPAYMEDIDLRWRMAAFGFKKAGILRSDPNATHFYHFNGGNARQKDEVGPFDTEDNSTHVRYLHTLARRGPRGEYALAKYGDRSANVWAAAPLDAKYQFKFFDIERYPLDTWVTDPHHRLCFHQKTYNRTKHAWMRPKICAYNSRVLIENGILGEEQSDALESCLSRE